MRNIVNIWQKEVMDTLRDKRALLRMIRVPLIIGVFYAFVTPALSRTVVQQSQAPLSIPTQGVEYAGQDFLTALARQQITLTPYDGDINDLVTNGGQALALVIPADFQADLTNGKPADLKVLTNVTTGGIFSGHTSDGRLELAISTFEQAIVVQRAAAHSLDPAMLTPIAIQTENLSTPAQVAGASASFTLPLLLALVVVQGGLFIAIDVTAGEKERGTLEALLVTPASDLEVMIGKLLAVFSFSAATFVLTVVGFYAAGVLLPKLTQNGALPLSVVLVSLVASIPLAFFASIVLMVLSVRTSSFKDAQSAAAPLSIAAMIPTLAATFVPPANLLAYLIPVYGPAAVIGQIASSGGVIDPAPLVMCIAGSLIAAAVAFVIGMRLFNRERLLYGV